MVLVIDTDLEGDPKQVTALHWGPSAEHLQCLELMALWGRAAGEGRTSSQNRLPQGRMFLKPMCPLDVCIMVVHTCSNSLSLKLTLLTETKLRAGFAWR